MKPVAGAVLAALMLPLGGIPSADADVGTRAAERAREAASARARATVEENVGKTVSEAVAGNVSDRARGTVERAASEAAEEATAARAQQQARESVEEGVSDRVRETVEHGASRSAEEAAAARAEGQVRETVTGGVEAASERGASQAAENAAAEAAANRARESVATEADRVAPKNRADSAGRKLEKNLPEAARETEERAAETGDRLRQRNDGSSGLAAEEDKAGGETAEAPPSSGARGARTGAQPDSAGSDLPERLAIRGREGETVLVDVRLDDGWRAAEREWVLMVSDAEMALLQGLDVAIVERSRLEAIDMSLVRLQVDDSLDTWAELDRQLPERLLQRLDRNHIYSYQPQSGPEEAASGQESPRSAICAEPVKVGVVDTGVETRHPALRDVAITDRTFVDERIELPVSHGTAVAGLLVGRGERLQPLLPDASLVVASTIYQRRDGSGGATLMNLLQALDWLAGQSVDVINLSLAGPPNKLLEMAVARLREQGVPVVAAVGNDGPAAPPLYPAAYPGVLGATAVDRERRVYRWANRGEPVDFAALGVGVLTARAGGGAGPESGTSMAAPVVAAHAGCAVRAGRDPAAALAENSVDLGEAGRDPVFGHGLLPAYSFKRTAREARVSE